MKLHLVNNRNEWTSVVAKLINNGYKWAKYNPAISVIDVVNLVERDSFVNPIIIIVLDGDKKLYWCSTIYISTKFPNEYKKLVRREKIKKLNEK